MIIGIFNQNIGIFKNVYNKTKQNKTNVKKKNHRNV